MTLHSNAPIGVFDSGLGGLTVVRAVRQALPEENIVYLGDTARVPYGSRSAHTIIRYARTCATHLAARNIKMLVVACNTVSAVALDMLRVEFDIPVIGVIEPGARAGVAATRNGRLGVIATRGTVASGAYPRAVASVESRAEVFAHAAPLLVPLAEEGWLSGPVPETVLRDYLQPLEAMDIDTLVLGCTHYPLLRPVIEEVSASMWKRPLAVVDGAEATADEVASFLDARGLRTRNRRGLEILVTDIPDRFAEVASRFLGDSLSKEDVVQVDL